jgi:hypothetical protein
MADVKKDLFSKSFTHGKRSYSIYVNETIKGDKYLCLIEKAPDKEGKEAKNRMTIFENYAPEFKEALSEGLDFVIKNSKPKGKAEIKA